MAIFDASPSSVFVVKHQFGRRWKQWDHRTAACVFWTYVARSWLLPVKRPAHQLANGDRHGMRSSTAHRAEYMLQFTVDLRINIVTQYTHIFSPSRGSEDVGERISTWNPKFILLYWSILVSFLLRLPLIQSSLVVARFILVARIHDPELCKMTRRENLKHQHTTGGSGQVEEICCQSWVSSHPLSASAGLQAIYLNIAQV